RAVDLHRRQERLGRLSDTGCRGKHADQRLHADGGLSPARRRRPLGSAGAAGAGERIAHLLPAGPAKDLTTQALSFDAARRAKPDGQSMNKCFKMSVIARRKTPSSNPVSSVGAQPLPGSYWMPAFSRRMTLR